MFEKKFLYRSKEGPRIIIIGAGVAGLAAATRLFRQGYRNVKIIEAEDRIGGRVHSVQLKDCTVDLGAHWVHGESGNVVYELAQQYGMVHHSGDFNNGHLVLSDGSEIDHETVTALKVDWQRILEDYDAMKEFNGTLYDYIMDRASKFAGEKLSEDTLIAYMDWLIKYECTIEGCDSLTEPSTAGLTHYKECKGDGLIDWKGCGYKNVINILLGSHKGSKEPSIDLEDKLVLRTEVEQIDYSGLGVSVKCKGGGMYTGDYAILTVSLGVLKEKYKTLFYPPLSLEKRKSILGLGIGTVNKIYIKFPYAWWPKHCTGFSLLWLKNDKASAQEESLWEREIIGFYAESSTPTTLTAWLIGEAARDMEIHSVEQVKKGCIRVLRKFLSNKYEIPEPEDITRSCWYSNPHFRGSYSFRSMNSEALDVYASNLAEPIKNSFGRDVIMFAGEATHDCFYSTVHGAIETGWREAERLIAMDKKALKQVRMKSSL